MDGWPTEKKEIYHIRWHHTSRTEMNRQHKTALSFMASESSYRQTLKELVHSSHLGVEGSLRRAKECLFWPNMSADLKDV